MVRHVVVFKYKADSSEAHIETLTKAFASLQEKIPGILSFEHGVNNSPEGKNLGFTHVYVLTFENEAARDTYLPHPEHQNFIDMLVQSGIFEDAFVVDYTV
jgi:Stress responsive A/B Barrel Domain